MLHYSCQLTKPQKLSQAFKRYVKRKFIYYGNSYIMEAPLYEGKNQT